MSKHRQTVKREKPARIVVSRTGLMAAMVVMAGLGGCQTASDVTGSLPMTYAQRHPIVLQNEPRFLDIAVTSRAGQLNSDTRQTISHFVATYREQGNGPMVIMAPSGTRYEMAVQRTVRLVRRALRQSGVPGALVKVRVFSAARSKGVLPVRLSYKRLAAKTGACGYWPKDLQAGTSNTNHWNFGCASQQNLAAMVENPRDFVQPRGWSAPDQQRRSQIYKKYQTGENTGTNYSDDLKAQVSKVATQ